MRSDSVAPLLRRGLLALAILTCLGTSVELAVEHHWTHPAQLLAWAAVAVALLAVALLWRQPGPGRLRLARVLAAAVVLTSAVGVWEHVAANYDAGPLNVRYARTWDALGEPTRWWLAVTKAVGASPPLAPGALAQAGLCVLLASVRYPKRQNRPDRVLRNGTEPLVSHPTRQQAA